MNLFNKFFIDGETYRFNSFLKNKFKSSEVSEGIILVEVFEVERTIIAFSYFCNVLSKYKNAKIHSFSLSNYPSFFFNIFNRKVLSTYKAFKANKNITSYVNEKSLNFLAEKTFEEIKQSINKKDDVLKIKFKEIDIGVHIYEAFLIESRNPTLELNKEFFKFLHKCVKNAVYWDNYFEKNIIKALILSHGIYRYGILKEIALSKNIPVYLPSSKTLYFLTRKEQLGIPEFEKFPEIFKSFSKEKKKKALDLSKKRIKLRLSGKVGVDMDYSKKSAFKNSKEKSILTESNNLKVLITSHCFFDNPNAYGPNIFSDFYDWINFLGKISEETNYDWYLKTHPDVLEGNIEILNNILEKYPKIKLIPSDSSHKQLIDEGIKYVFTVYGSVGHELPFLGAIVINAGLNNPHKAYEFNIHAKNINEYEEIIKNLSKTELNPDLTKLYEFYYLYYFHSVNNNLIFKSEENFSNLNLENHAYSYFLKESSESRHLEILNTMFSFIDSKEYKFYEK